MVTADGFFWLFAAVSALGLLNLIVAIYDEKRLDASNQQAEQDRDKLAKLVNLIGSSRTPPHLQDLKRLTSSELKDLIAISADAARQLELEYCASWAGPPSWWGQELSAEEIQLLRKKDEDQNKINRSAYERAYFNAHLPNLQALWEEVENRTGDFSRRDVLDSKAITYGSLAGPSPIRDALKTLESKARRLPNDY